MGDNVITACIPRDEVLHGQLDDAIFAANLDDLVHGVAKPVYLDPATFFANTHPARPLTLIASRVFEHLCDAAKAGTFIRLSTGFGGGKTHALMTLWHLAKNSGDASLGTDIVPAVSRPPKVTVVAVDCGRAGRPNFSIHVEPNGESVTTHSLWGEIAYQLGGRAAVDALGEGERADRNPSQQELLRLFPEGPVLILIDEMVIYMAGANEQERGNLLDFVNKLIGICTNRPQTALLISDPAQQAVYAQESARLMKEMEAARDLDQITGRTATDEDPIGDESSAVINRRLFKSIDRNGADETAGEYHSLYERLLADPSGRLVPEEATRSEYRDLIVRNYPFHPSLMRTTRDRLSTIPEYNRSRGTLRLFAKILRNVYDRGLDVSLITAGEVDFSDPEISSELLHRLNRDAFSGAVNTDLGEHCDELDVGADRGVHTRVASALLLESLTGESNAGFNKHELTLAVVRPDEAGNEPGDAVERLLGTCWYTYRMDSGTGFQFRVEPNVNQMIAGRAPLVAEEDARARVRSEVQAYFQGPVFKVVAWPQNARQVPDSARLQLALCESIEVARKVTSLANDEDPAAEQPRQFRNAIVAVAPADDPYQNAVRAARRLLAAQEINKEHQGESGKSIRDQLAPIVTGVTREVGFQARRALSNVVLADGQVRPIEEKYLVSSENMFSATTGQSNLREFLQSKQLIYQPGAKLDTDLYIQQIVSGATPSVHAPGAYSGRSLHERLLSRQGLRVVPDESVTRNSIIAGVTAGRLVVRTEDGSAYDATGAVVGTPTQRERRNAIALPPGFPLTDGTLIALAGEAITREWLEETAKPEPPDGPPPPPPPPPPLNKTSKWEQAHEWAEAGRALRRLTFSTGTASSAMTLSTLAQPFGANTLKVTVGCQGTGKNNSGSFKLLIEDVLITHPTNPLGMAMTIYNSLDEASRTFTARVLLDFSTAGRTGLADTLDKARQAAAADVTIEAEFVPATTPQEKLL